MGVLLTKLFVMFSKIELSTKISRKMIDFDCKKRRYLDIFKKIHSKIVNNEI